MIEDALEVLATTMLGTLATINEDGSPWSTPVQLSFRNGVIVWLSGIDAVHSKNLVRDNRVSITVCDTTLSPSRAVFISSRVSISGETTFSKEYRQTMAEFSAPLGDLDETKSEPNRYYFRFTERGAA